MDIAFFEEGKEQPLVSFKNQELEIVIALQGEKTDRWRIGFSKLNLKEIQFEGAVKNKFWVSVQPNMDESANIYPLYLESPSFFFVPFLNLNVFNRGFKRIDDNRSVFATLEHSDEGQYKIIPKLDWTNGVLYEGESFVLQDNKTGSKEKFDILGFPKQGVIEAIQDFEQDLR